MKAEPVVEEAIRGAIKEGDVPKLRALAGQFADSFEALRYEDLVDLAVTHQQAAAILYLTLAHRFEVSPTFERNKKSYGGDLFAEGVNEYHQTMEVMASAALRLGHEKERSVACGGVRDFAVDVASNIIPKPLHPEFLRAAANGDLQHFVEHWMRDERYQRCENRHSGYMLKSLNGRHEAVKNYATALFRAVERKKGQEDRSLG